MTRFPCPDTLRNPVAAVAGGSVAASGKSPSDSQANRARCLRLTVDRDGAVLGPLRSRMEASEAERVHLRLRNSLRVEALGIQDQSQHKRNNDHHDVRQVPS